MKNLDRLPPFRVLLVEDDRIVRVTVRDALAEAGYKVYECADGSTALKLMESESLDLLLTDIRLPGTDGITLFRRLRHLQPSSVAVLMTAYGEVNDAVSVMREGAHDYITKPFEIDALILRIERIRQELDFKKKAELSLACGEEPRRLGTSLWESPPTWVLKMPPKFISSHPNLDDR